MKRILLIGTLLLNVSLSYASPAETSGAAFVKVTDTGTWPKNDFDIRIEGDAAKALFDNLQFEADLTGMKSGKEMVCQLKDAKYSCWFAFNSRGYVYPIN